MARVLVAEDNEDNFNMISRRLERKGLEVIGARNGIEAIEAARTQSPDIILMDISMPGMSGLEATRALRDEPATRNLPIIALTAHVGKKDRDECFAAGCDAFEGKPVNFANLMETMANVLSIKGKQLV
ncbi:MAG: two-component system response regulator [Ponticaulis sp.]|nr:two-component system response regulator [Ponticaulis sp.]|tara:strand:- start:6305 stop:6688 length:384 start_codon:yes stop_codon:yes gene_type:complete